MRSICIAFPLLAALSLPVQAQFFDDDEPLTTIASCFQDGINGGNVSRRTRASTCFGDPFFAARDDARERSEEAAQSVCPAVNAAVAQARCASIGKTFNPAASINVQVTNEDGTSGPEIEAFVVDKFDASGRCTMSRVRPPTERGTNGTCGFVFTWPRRFAEVTVRSYCGFVCQ